MKKQAVQGDWVEITKVVLRSEERPKYVPEDTRTYPLVSYTFGFLKNKHAEEGEHVKIKTPIGRIVEGILEDVNPTYAHDFGSPVPELLNIRIDSLKKDDFGD